MEIRKAYESHTLKMSIEAQKMNGREPCGDFKFSKIIQLCNFNPLIWSETA